jgi:hypothetical protein
MSRTFDVINANGHTSWSALQIKRFFRRAGFSFAGRSNRGISAMPATVKQFTSASG